MIETDEAAYYDYLDACWSASLAAEEASAHYERVTAGCGHTEFVPADRMVDFDPTQPCWECRNPDCGADDPFKP